jgi:8-oxo-dGTP pyrophosphatase MutT (NUDIX family)
LPEVLSEIVELCVFRVTQELPQYLILQRSSNDNLYPGIWQILTGTIDESENALNTVLRELYEETGLSARRLWTVPFVDSYYDLSKDVIQLSAVFAARVDDDKKIHLSAEHQKYE